MSWYDILEFTRPNTISRPTSSPQHSRIAPTQACAPNMLGCQLYHFYLQPALLAIGLCSRQGVCRLSELTEPRNYTTPSRQSLRVSTRKLERWRAWHFLSPPTKLTLSAWLAQAELLSLRVFVLP
jgi:hypothetical protein